MAPDDEEDEDLYDDEFDFVDDDDDEEDDEEMEDSDEADESEADDDGDAEVDEEPASREAVAERDSFDEVQEAVGEGDENVDEYGRPEPPANHVVHIYEYRQFKRTIDRPFTAEDAEAFASEYNRTSKPYGRFAIAGKDDAKPRKMLD
jgi:hypothetical protein